ncbi:hypothetical protein HRbin36_00502 [bacterium HR36]|nr:hypothetical protein HRbin36_00502 [bacterium HR36]
MTATDVLTWLSVAHLCVRKWPLDTRWAKYHVCKVNDLGVHKWQLRTSEKQRHAQGLIVWSCANGSSTLSPTSWPRPFASVA